MAKKVIEGDHVKSYDFGMAKLNDGSQSRSRAYFGDDQFLAKNPRLLKFEVYISSILTPVRISSNLRNNARDRDF